MTRTLKRLPRMGGLIILVVSFTTGCAMIAAGEPLLGGDDCLAEAALLANGLTLQPSPLNDISMADVNGMIQRHASDLKLTIQGIAAGTITSPSPIFDGRNVVLTSVSGAPAQFTGGLESNSREPQAFCTIWAFDLKTGDFAFGIQTEI